MRPATRPEACPATKGMLPMAMASTASTNTEVYGYPHNWHFPSGGQPCSLRRRICVAMMTMYVSSSANPLELIKNRYTFGSKSPNHSAASMANPDARMPRRGTSLLSFSHAGAMPSSARERIILPSPNMAASMVDNMAETRTTFSAPPAQPIPCLSSAATNGLVCVFIRFVGISNSIKTMELMYSPVSSITVLRMALGTDFCGFLVSVAASPKAAKHNGA